MALYGVAQTVRGWRETLVAAIRANAPRKLNAPTISLQARMSPLRRLAFIGNSLPRRCGIATFTTDLQQAVGSSATHPDTAIVAMTDRGQDYDYPAAVRLQINEQNAEEYARAADFLNGERFDAVCNLSWLRVVLS